MPVKDGRLVENWDWEWKELSVVVVVNGGRSAGLDCGEGRFRSAEFRRVF